MRPAVLNTVHVVAAMLLVAFLIVSASPAGTAASSSLQEHKGFVLAAGECTSGDTECELRGPKAWTPDEARVIKRAIDEIHAATRGAEILQRVQRVRATSIRRYRAGVVDGTAIPFISAAFRRVPGPPTIEIYDKVLLDADARDLQSGKPGYSFLAGTLLHECLHAIDIWSWRPDFARTMGFVNSEGRWGYVVTGLENAIAMAQFDKELARVRSLGSHVAELRINRQFALDMRPVGLPTMQARKSPSEAFAEIGSHLILDPGARKYLPEPIVRLFDERVFGVPPAKQ